jgi:hypothetical protein
MSDGCLNFAAGHGALTNNTAGCYNFAQGYRTLEGNTTGNNNIILNYIFIILFAVYFNQITSSSFFFF